MAQTRKGVLNGVRVNIRKIDGRDYYLYLRTTRQQIAEDTAWQLKKVWVYRRIINNNGIYEVWVSERKTDAPNYGHIKDNSNEVFEGGQKIAGFGT